MASSSSHSSIVMPVLGAGKLDYPLEDAIPTIISTISKFSSKRRKTSSLKTVTFIIFDGAAGALEVCANCVTTISFILYDRCKICNNQCPITNVSL